MKNWMWYLAVGGAAWFVFIRKDELGSTMWENWSRPAGQMR